MTLHSALKLLNEHLTETKQLAADAHIWANLDWNSIKLPSEAKPFSKQHKDLVVQIAFFQSFLEWEQFLEESFILYLLGHHPPKGIPPKCYANPPDRATAEKMVAEGRRFPDWTVASLVIDRASRFFGDGKPYSDILKLRQTTLEEIKTIRNALAHSSQNSKMKFRKLVLNELGNFPNNMTIGRFLDMTIPSSSSKAKNYKHPVSYFEFYVDTFLWLAKEIIPV
jgi:hypothetical protein